MPRGDITAGEIYEDRELLNRLGYGIFDVNFGSAGAGFENIKDFTYLVAPDQDPRMYRRTIFDLTGRYFPGEIAKEIWDRIVDHKWVLSEEAGKEVDLRTTAHDWMEKYSQAFLKEWTFNQTDIPQRIRTRREPRKGLLSLVTGLVMPNLQEFLNAGFTVTDVVKANIIEQLRGGKVWRKVTKKSKAKDKDQPPFPISAFYLRTKMKRPKKSKNEQGFFALDKLPRDSKQDGLYYVRLIANLTDHTPQTPEEAEKLWAEILEHKWYMSERAGYDVGIQAAAVDYFRRLKLLESYKTGEQA